MDIISTYIFPIAIIYFIGLLATIFFSDFIAKQKNSLDKSLSDYLKFSDYLEKNNFNKYDIYNSDEKTQEEKYIKLIELCNKFLKDNPENINAFEEKAHAYFAIKKYKEALHHYNLLKDKFPEKFLYVNCCAECQAYTGNINAAFDLINRFYMGELKDSRYYNAIGSIYKITGEYNKALESYSQAIKLNPDEIVNYAGRSNVYQALNKEDEYNADKAKIKELIEKERKSNEDKEKQEIEKSKKPGILKIILRVILLITVVGAQIYFNPTSESMICDTQYNCNVKRTYFGIFNFEKKFQLHHSSNMSCDVRAYMRGKRSSRYGLYIKFDNKSPLVYYITDSNYSTYSFSKEELMRNCESLKYDFYNYTKNPEQRLYINTGADVSNLIFISITTIVFTVILFVI